MGKRSRDKGKRGELEAAHALADVTGRPWQRTVGQSRSGSDAADVERADGETEAWVEVKRGKRTSYRAAMKQAAEATDGRPVWALTRDDHGEWVLHVRLADVWSLASLGRDAMAERLRRREEESDG